ncbi:hypothetical protein LguiA_021252 [Lonicera macranthoides]
MKLSHCRKLPEDQTTVQTIISPSINPSSSSTPISSSINNGSSTATKRPFITYKPNQTQHFDSSVALTILVVIISLFSVAFLSLYICRRTASVDEVRRRRRPYSFNNSRSERSKGLKLSTVRSLPQVPYGGDAKHGIGDCVICLSEFEERETVKMIPYCRHVFHPECIDTWLESHVSCPLCRSTII